MSVDYKIDSMFELRKFLWNELKENNIFDPNDYYSDNINMEVVPIIPVQQQPELNQFLSGKKHIVYDKIGMSYEDIWLLCCEKILFTVYSTDVSEINEIRNLMTDLFRRMDDTAEDINNFIGSNSPFIFFSVSLIDLLSPEPEREKVGWQAGQVVIRYKYGRQISSSTGRFS